MKNMPKITFVYAGRRGVGLDSALALYEVSKKAGFASRLVLSRDNMRKELVERLYPEVEFLDFSSLPALMEEAHRLSGGVTFFTMISPKLLPLFLASGAKKVFYFHATFDSSFNQPSIGSYFADKYFDMLHFVAIKKSDVVAATQYPLAWQVRARFGKEAVAIPHPPFSLIRKGFFDDRKEVEMPFPKGSYFLDFGGIDRLSKGTEVLFKAVQGTSLPTVFAGKSGAKLEGKNIVHLDRWLSDGELHSVLQGAKCVVAPYLTASQFSSCAALAFRFGKPVLAPFSPTFEGWVDKGKTGWFFSQGDWNDLRSKMELVASGKASYSAKAIALKEKEMESKSCDALSSVLGRLA